MTHPRHVGQRAIAKSMRNFWHHIAVPEASPWADRRCDNAWYRSLDWLWCHSPLAFAIVAGPPITYLYWPLALLIFGLIPTTYVLWDLWHRRRVK